MSRPRSKISWPIRCVVNPWGQVQVKAYIPRRRVGDGVVVWSVDVHHRAIVSLRSRIDHQHGGLGNRPIFSHWVGDALLAEWCKELMRSEILGIK